MCKNCKGIDKILSRAAVISKINEIIRENENLCGHAFSGGTGYSYFLNVWVTPTPKKSPVSFAFYGNGVEIDVLEAAFQARVPGFSRLEASID